MGSFNVACMASHQVITPNTEVIIFPIYQESSFNPIKISNNNQHFSPYGISHSNCYPNAFWNYAGPLIRASYSDYGTFELLNTKENIDNIIQFFNHLFIKSFKTEKGMHEYRDSSFNIKEIYNSKSTYSFNELSSIWKEIEHAITNNRLFVSDYNEQPRQLKLTAIHHITADYLIELYNTTTTFSNLSLEMKSYFKYYVQTQLQRVINRKIDNDNTSKQFDFLGHKIAMLDGYNINGREISIFYDKFEPILDIVNEFHKKNPNKTQLPNNIINNLFKEHYSQIQHRYIHNSLDMLNIKLYPLFSASQDNENIMGQNYAKMITTVSEKINQEINQNYSEINKSSKINRHI